MRPDLTTERTLRDLAEAGSPSVAIQPFLAERVVALRRRSRRRRRIGVSLALAGLVAGGVVAARRSGETRFYSVYEPSSSMAPTLTVGEHLLADRTLTPSRGDLVEVHGNYEGHVFTSVRRVIALPGDVIACPAGRDGHCHGWTRNGQVLSEPYIGRDPGSPPPPGMTVLPGFFIGGGGDIAPYAAVTVTPGHFFELGDNREFAVDSRMRGLAQLSGIDGVGVEVVGTDGRRRAIRGAPQHEVPGPGGTVDPPGELPTSRSQPVVTQPVG